MTEQERIKNLNKFIKIQQELFYLTLDLIDCQSDLNDVKSICAKSRVEADKTFTVLNKFHGG